MPKGIGYGRKKKRRTRSPMTKAKGSRKAHKGHGMPPKRNQRLKGKLRKRLYVRAEDRTFVPEGFYAKKPPKSVRRYTRRRGLSGSPTVFEQVKRKKRRKKQ